MITVVTLVHLYVFLRPGSLSVRKRHLNRKGLIAVGVSFWLVFFISRVYKEQTPGLLSGALQVVGMHWMGGACFSLRWGSLWPL